MQVPRIHQKNSSRFHPVRRKYRFEPVRVLILFDSWYCIFLCLFYPAFPGSTLALKKSLIKQVSIIKSRHIPPLIVHNITARHVATSLMLTLILQVAKETANSEVTVPVSLSELQNLSGRRPSSLSSVLVSHPLDHTILLKLILLPDTGFTYLPSASPWPGTEQNLCILSILRHQMH